MFLNAPPAVDTVSPTPYRSWHQYILLRENKLTTSHANPVAACMTINKPGLMACVKAPQALINQIAYEANRNPGFKCWKVIDPEMALLVYKK
ncbi:hypothetical protein EHN07_06500 [Buttiauxella warmboldiae]|uniref:Uncharacterized protein n=1 Tax=Buttiauxella warmboldiae TaxID=82993 RepID=A0A3N5DKW4_9ENTR|nr:hypothetical protein [Buttiauxella warmboldiae]RPH29295.1 hypothetical protein EHN07_06500 [Buttiauxella warmboldiae]